MQQQPILLRCCSTRHSIQLEGTVEVQTGQVLGAERRIEQLGQRGGWAMRLQRRRNFRLADLCTVEHLHM